MTPEEKRLRAKDARLRARYGISLEQFNLILESQGNVCAVCKEPDKVFCVDHNHKTLKIRGIICLNCNLRVVGGARDHDYKLINAAEYVTNHPADKVFPEGLYLLKNPPKTRRKRRAVSRRRVK
ncbi:MAG: endonuclease VII domain-containing protein [Chitinophagaceae bacterium]